MGRDDLYVAVPSFFICPISLDVMKSPVSLCTGVTYDRSSIQRWLDCGNNTCPATMQVLHSKDLVPNHTLQRLIQIWSDSVKSRRSDPNPPRLSQDQARVLTTQIQQNQNCLESISKLVSFAKISDQNCKFLASIDRFVPILVETVCSNSNFVIENSIGFAEETLVLLELVLIEYRDREYITKLIIEKKDRFTSSILFVLKQGNLTSRIAVARVLEFVSTDTDSKLFFVSNTDLMSELFRLMSSDSDSAAIEASLSTLIYLSKPKRIRPRIVRLGAVKLMAKLISDSNQSVTVNERALKVLEMASTCKEGRAEICGDEDYVSAVVRKMLKVSTTATEHAVTVLWSLCYLFREEVAEKVVEKNNGVTKILVLMQSNCSPAVRQMAGDLLKIFRVKNSKSCLSSYETKTTHIMPF